MFRILQSTNPYFTTRESENIVTRSENVEIFIPCLRWTV